MNQHLPPEHSSRLAADLDIAAKQLVDAEVDSVPQPRVPDFKTPGAQILFGLSLVLIAYNLRPVFSSASALLPEIDRGS